MTDDPIKQMHAARDFPAGTCGASRHAAMIAEELCKDGPYEAVLKNSEHCGGSIAATVTALWKCRAKLAQAQTWQPIETAPKDGTAFLAFGGGLGGVDICAYSARVGCWSCGSVTLDDTECEPEGYNRPTHWMPLPEPPAPTNAGNLTHD